MAIDRQEVTATTRAMERVTTADLVDRLSRFDGPPEQFLAHLLTVQCRLSGAGGGVVFRLNAEGRVEVLAMYPPAGLGRPLPEWLSQAAELAPKAVADGRTAVRPCHSPADLYGQPADRHLVLVPLKGAGGIRGVSAFVLEARDPSVLSIGRERIELTTSLLSLYEMRLTLQQRQTDLRRLRMSLETLAAVNEPQRFAGVGMAACNEITSRWNCDRVSLGLLKGRYVQLKAMSHTEKFNRKMKLVQDTEAAMEECLDQDVEVLHPAPKESTYVSRATAELSARHGPTAVLSLPLRQGGEVRGVLTLERPLDQPFTGEEVESLRLACELCTPRLVNLYEQDRWFGARLAATARKGLGKVLGPTHTWIKLLALGVVAVVLFLVLAKGDYTAEGSFVLQPVRKQMIQAPFDGHLVEVNVEPNDVVTKGQVLARLDTQELLGQLAEQQAELHKHQETVKATRAMGKIAEMRVTEEQGKQTQARIDVLQYRIDAATLTSPIDGTVTQGDWTQQVGRSVKAGDLLFEVAPLGQLRAELRIPEDQMADVRKGRAGELATPQYPGRRIPCVVERVYPVADVEGGDNVFKVRVAIAAAGEYDWLRPGMEGVGKIELGRRSYAWLWTHKLVNWVRMKFWL